MSMISLGIFSLAEHALRRAQEIYGAQPDPDWRLGLGPVLGCRGLITATDLTDWIRGLE